MVGSLRGPLHYDLCTMWYVSHMFEGCKNPNFWFPWFLQIFSRLQLSGLVGKSGGHGSVFDSIGGHHPPSIVHLIGFRLQVEFTLRQQVLHSALSEGHPKKNVNMLEQLLYSFWFKERISNMNQNEIKDKPRLPSLSPVPSVMDTLCTSFELIVTSVWPSSSRSLRRSRHVQTSASDVLFLSGSEISRTTLFSSESHLQAQIWIGFELACCNHALGLEAQKKQGCGNLIDRRVRIMFFHRQLAWNPGWSN